MWLKHWQAGWRLYLGPADRETEEPPSGWGSVTMSSSAPSSKKLASASWGCKTSMQMWQHETGSKIILTSSRCYWVTRLSWARVKHSRGLSDLATVSLTYFLFLFVHWWRWYSEETLTMSVLSYSIRPRKYCGYALISLTPPHVILPWSRGRWLLIITIYLALHANPS